MRGDLWIYVLEAALEDRQDFMRRLKARPMKYATELEKLELENRIYHAQKDICEICADLEKARGES
jgi:hypothetical protein